DNGRTRSGVSSTGVMDIESDGIFAALRVPQSSIERGGSSLNNLSTGRGAVQNRLCEPPWALRLFEEVAVRKSTGFTCQAGSGVGERFWRMNSIEHSATGVRVDPSGCHASAFGRNHGAASDAPVLVGRQTSSPGRPY